MNALIHVQVDLYLVLIKHHVFQIFTLYCFHVHVSVLLVNWQKGIARLVHIIEYRIHHFVTVNRDILMMVFMENVNNVQINVLHVPNYLLNVNYVKEIDFYPTVPVLYIIMMMVNQFNVRGVEIIVQHAIRINVLHVFLIESIHQIVYAK